MGKIAKVRNFSRHDAIIINGNKYSKDEWLEIDDDIAHEELTIIEEPTQKKSKAKRGDYGNG